MTVTYYPGCTLRTQAKELDRYARRCAEILGFSLCEPADWQCCGGAFTAAKDEIATKLAAVRALKAARAAGQPLVTVCAACHQVIKRTNLAMTDPAFAEKVNVYLSQEDPDGVPYHGETPVYHYIEFLRDRIGFDAVREKVRFPLTGQRIAPYYGCLLLRPGREMNFDDPENPAVLEDLLRALGAEPVFYPQRNECCGAYMAVRCPEAASRRSRGVVRGAVLGGAERMLTACPLCRYNLIKSGAGLPVVYFTELLAEALGVKEDPHGV